jgi:transcriptional regulator GlxA family with amidase domain
MASGTRRPRRPHRVVTVLVDGMSQLETAVATEFFGDPPPWGIPWYSFRLCSDGGRELRLQGMRVMTDAGPEAIRQADTVIIPGWNGVDSPASPELVAELQRAHRRGARMVSFCTGAFPLAQAGLLDGLEATTHWSHAETFRQRFPQVRLNPSALYVDAGQVLTAAGSASAIDLALHIIRSDHGAEVANQMARALVVPPHRQGGQAQFIEAPMPQTRDGEVEPFSATLDWAIEHLDESLSISALAAHAAMSPRHFSRRFKETTGTSPHQWLLAQRLDLARRLLETTDDSIDVIASRAGFGTATALRQHFRSQLHTTPQAYRRTFDCSEPDELTA